MSNIVQCYLRTYVNIYLNVNIFLHVSKFYLVPKICKFWLVHKICLGKLNFDLYTAKFVSRKPRWHSGLPTEQHVLKLEPTTQPHKGRVRLTATWVSGCSWWILQSVFTTQHEHFSNWFHIFQMLYFPSNHFKFFVRPFHSLKYSVCKVVWISN